MAAGRGKANEPRNRARTVRAVPSAGGNLARTPDFIDYVLQQLPPAPARVLEVGCGREGGVAPALAAVGYDVLAIDPEAPEGPLYRRVTLEDLDDAGPFDAAVAGRVLHHVDPLGPALEKLIGLAPLVILEEFASDRIDAAARDWYQEQYRNLAAGAAAPRAPADLEEWRAAHPGLHPYESLRRELDVRYDVRDFHWGPYLYRWLRDPRTKVDEERLIASGKLQPIGFRYTGIANRL
jgi:Methyltransferase domain